MKSDIWSIRRSDVEYTSDRATSVWWDCFVLYWGHSVEVENSICRNIAQIINIDTKSEVRSLELIFSFIYSRKNADKIFDLR